MYNSIRWYLTKQYVSTRRVGQLTSSTSITVQMDQFAGFGRIFNKSSKKKKYRRGFTFLVTFQKSFQKTWPAKDEFSIECGIHTKKLRQIIEKNHMEGQN